MEKILISRDETSLNNAIEMINEELIPMVQKICNEYIKLEIGNFTLKALDDILGNLYDTTERYIENQEKALKKAGIRGENLSKLLNIALNDLNRLKELKSEYESLEREVKYYRRHIAVENNNVILPPKSLSNIENRYSRYISTEKEKELYELHLQAINNLNKLIDAYKTPGNGLPTTVDNIINILMKIDNNNESVLMGNINYSLLT